MRFREAATGWWALALGGLGACSAGAAGEIGVERTDSAGVEIVRNSGSDRLLDWTFRPVLVLGGEEEGPESFYRVGASQVDVDDAGNLYVFDRDNHRLVSFDSSGAVRWMTGQRGGGPGEFNFVLGISVRPDGVIEVRDMGNSRLGRYDTAGDYLGSERLEFGTLTATGRAIATGRVGLINEMGTGANAQHLLHVSPSGDTTVLRTGTRPDPQMMQFEGCRIGFPANPVFTPRLTWATNRRIVVEAHAAEYALWISEAGTVVRSVRRDRSPVETTAELAAMEYPNGFTIRAASASCEIPAADIVAKAGYSSPIPAVDNIRIAPDGTLWVQRGRDADGAQRTDLFAPNGAYLGTLPAEAPWPIAFLPDGRPLAAEPDELDITRVVVYHVRERP